MNVFEFVGLTLSGMMAMMGTLVGFYVVVIDRPRATYVHHSNAFGRFVVSASYALSGVLAAGVLLAGH